MEDLAGLLGAKPRIGHRMQELADIVSAMPGCSKSAALRAAGLPTRGVGSAASLTGLLPPGSSLLSTCARTAADSSPATATAAAGTLPARS